MNTILVIAFHILLIIFLNNFFFKRKILIDKKQLIHKSFASKQLVPISGGFLILVNLLFFSSNYQEKIFFLGIFSLGIFSDLLIIQNPLKKFCIQFFIVVSFLLLLNISILSTKGTFVEII